MVSALQSNSAFAQANESKIPDNIVAEKVYLQLSSNVFGLGQTLWFKAIVTDARNHFPSKLSAVLYVELINADKEMVDRHLIKLRDGIGHGSLEFQKNYPQVLTSLGPIPSGTGTLGTNLCLLPI